MKDKGVRADHAEMSSFKGKNIWVVKSNVEGEINKNSEQQHNNIDYNKNCLPSKFRVQVRNIIQNSL